MNRGPIGALCLSVTFTLITGCGGSQLPISASGAMAQTSGLAQHASHGKSWMLPEASGEDLLYITRCLTGTCVLSYPTGQLVGTVDGGRAYGAGACVDGEGNVFIANDDNVLEYAHGDASPFATFSLPGTQARGCSVDHITGNLAVTFEGLGYDVAIFPKAQGIPTLYPSGVQSWYCGYDNAGNLFVNGLNTAQPALAELPAGGSKFIPLSITYKVGFPGEIQWDGRSITWESLSEYATKISRLAVSGSAANIVGTMVPRGISGRAGLSWIYGPTVIIPFARKGDRINKVGVWEYRRGRTTSTYKDFGGKNAELQAATLSPAPDKLRAQH